MKEEEKEVSYEVDDSWKSVDIVENIGQIGGLSHSADKKQLVVFHRAGTVTFNYIIRHHPAAGTIRHHPALSGIFRPKYCLQLNLI